MCLIVNYSLIMLFAQEICSKPEMIAENIIKIFIKSTKYLIVLYVELIIRISSLFFYYSRAWLYPSKKEKLRLHEFWSTVLLTNKDFFVQEMSSLKPTGRKLKILNSYKRFENHFDRISLISIPNITIPIRDIDI